MKNMKKILAMMLAVVMVLTLVACGGDTKDPTTEPTKPTDTQPATNPSVDTTDTAPTDSTEMPEYVLKETETVLLELFNTCPPTFPVMTWILDIENATMIKNYAGLENLENVLEVSVTEPVTSGIAYSIVLVKLADGTDANAVAEEMKNGVDTAKWDGVEVSELEVTVVDSYVLLAMMSSDIENAITGEKMTAQAVVDAFQSVAKEYKTPVDETEPSDPVDAE